MPAKKKTTRAAQLHPQPAHSDYDTDTANITDSAAPMAHPPPPRTNTELNIAVLRRYVPDIERIIAIAPFAVIYIFSPETQQWEKSGHEGTLFVCQLSANGLSAPRYNVVMLNRKSLDNFIAELFSGDDVEITEQYVILQATGADGSPDIYGLWIYSDADRPEVREVVANAIQECAVRAELARSVDADVDDNDLTPDVPLYNLDGAAGSQPTAAAPVAQQIDLMSLFNKGLPQSENETQLQTSNTAPQASSGTPARFVSSADTDFFRSSQSPVSAAQAQAQAQAPVQQNMLLDLFKTAKRS